MCRLIDNWKTRAIRAELEIEKVKREREQWRMSSVCRELREQRDRLAVALENIRAQYGGMETTEECECEDCVFLRPIDEALAAVEGGNDE
jgi:hypothetical protein